MAQDLDAIEMLEQQHRDVEDLFEELAAAENAEERDEIFAELADNIAIHSIIEERHFYPAVRARKTQEVVLQAFEEHLAIKRVLAELLLLKSDDPTFETSISMLKEQVEEHVEDEEAQLFLLAKQLFNDDELIEIGREMAATVDALEGESPRFRVRAEVEAAAPRA